MARKSKKISTNKIYLVVCCGYTEKNYLTIYKQINRLHYTVDVRLKVTKPRIQLEHAKKISKNYDKCFVLFDRDSFYPNINDAKSDINDFESNEKFKVVFSDECFDLWILSHFEKIRTSLYNRIKVFARLSTILGEDYESKKADTRFIHKIIGDFKKANENIAPIANNRFLGPSFDLDNFLEIFSL